MTYWKKCRQRCVVKYILSRFGFVPAEVDQSHKVWTGSKFSQSSRVSRFVGVWLSLEISHTKFVLAPVVNEIMCLHSNRKLVPVSLGELNLFFSLKSVCFLMYMV